MAHLVDKDRIVAEIEKCYNECLKRAKITDSDYWNAKADTYRNVLEILNDTLEVKEAVDAEIVEVEDNNNSIYAYTHLEICTDEDLSKICKAGDKAKVIIIKQK